MKKLIILIIVVLSTTLSFGQKKPNGWYFNESICFKLVKNDGVNYSLIRCEKIASDDVSTVEVFDSIRWINSTTFECFYVGKNSISPVASNKIGYKYEILSFDGANLTLYEYASPITFNSGTFILKEAQDGDWFDD